jgi:hypothetical protein
MHRALVSFLALVAAASTASVTEAFEREWRVGGGAGIATLDDAGLGPSVDVHAAYGLTDMFDVNLDMLGSRHRGDASTDVFSASLGAAYKIDILEWIPYVVVEAGAYHYGGDPGPNGEEGLVPGASIGLGLDYLVSRSFSLGLMLRQHTSFSDGLSFPYLSANLRADYRWGW